MLTHIKVRGAREHNLKGVDIDLPRDKLIVITGLSGSGKSSLAFDTIYAEGQRRYVESLSAYARQFLEMMQKPDVEHIDGLSPAISIEQKTTSRNPRSTVATVTEIYDYMRLLWARVGVPYSPVTGEPISAQTVSQMVDRVMQLPEGTRLYLLAPVVRGRKGEYRKELAEWQKAGFTRVRIDGEFYGIEEAPALDKKYKHDIEVVVDRIAVKDDIATRLADSFETALRLADGLAYVDLADGTVAELLSPSPSGEGAGGRGNPSQTPASGQPHPNPRIEARDSIRPEGEGLGKMKGAGPAQPHRLQREIRLPGFRLHDPGDRAAAVLLQRPARRLPGLRWPRRKAAVRRATGGAERGALAQEGRDRPLGEIKPTQPLLYAGAGKPRQSLWLLAGDAVARPSGRSAPHHPARHRRQARAAHLQGRAQGI
jgi:hypothetical protein